MCSCLKIFFFPLEEEQSHVVVGCGVLWGFSGGLYGFCSGVFGGGECGGFWRLRVVARLVKEVLVGDFGWSAGGDGRVVRKG